MNSLSSDLDYNYIMARKGTAGSLAIRADGQATCSMEIADIFPKTPLFFEFRGPRPGLQKDPLFLEIGNDHAYQTW